MKKTTQDIFKRMTQKYLERSQGQFAGFLDSIKEDHPDVYSVVKDEFCYLEAKHTLDHYRFALENLWREYTTGGDTGD